MKLLITILMLVVAAACGLFSLHFFDVRDYDLNWLLNLTAYASVVAGIYMITAQRRRKRFGHRA